ncbi:MAG: cell division protein FtsH, partial [Bdellovibrionota bacterium]
RCAEELVFKEITNGASNDIERATGLATAMVCNWGMSDKLGPINFKKSGITPFGYNESATDYSERTAVLIDEEVSRLVRENHDQAMRILQDNREVLDRLAGALILWETLDLEQVRSLINGKDIGVPIKAEPIPTADASKTTEDTPSPAVAGPGNVGPKTPAMA